MDWRAATSPFPVWIHSTQSWPQLEVADLDSYIAVASGSALGSTRLTEEPAEQDKQEASIFSPSSLYGNSS